MTMKGVTGRRIRRFVPMAPEGWPFVLPVLLLVFVLIALDWIVAAWLSGFVVVYIVFFFRDPPRRVPDRRGAVVAPADGRVVSMEVVDTDLLPGGRALRIGIFLSVLDVHVNRSPLPGEVRSTEYRPGKFLNALKAESAEENERMDIRMETEHGPVLVRQIAGLIARRIVCYAREGDRFERGERIGLIRFGSRTEVYLPPQAEPRVKVGAYVRGASTLVAQFPADAESDS